MSLFPITALPIGVNVQAPATPSSAQAAATQLASAVTAAAAVAQAADIADISAAVVQPTDMLLSTVASQAATTQNSMAPLLADLSAALDSSALPEAARATVQQILSAQTPLTSTTTASSLQSAVAGSGLFLEATIAASVTDNGASQALNTSGDMKALLLQLSSTLDPAALNPLTAALLGAIPQTRAQARLPQTLPPRPVIAGAVTAGTPVAKVSIGPETSREALTSSLHQEAGAALARLTMSQLASVPTPGAPTRWAFELPVDTGQGLAMAQFEISRDDHNRSGADGAEPTWRARFSVNVEPNGPVHAEVSLSGGRTRATLWAERDGAHQVLDAQQGELTAALAEAEGVDAAVRVIAGAPPNTEPQVAGRFVDRTS